ncbi:glycosyltransferase family 2 protein [Rhodococcus sp. OK302]|uniref:glycosyltransferase family 2 protein n=1 Tax=Rhodococcus sp. OK302 TaxID=1882769 RepID=UPI000B93A3B1|nr:glycosyltransferase family 2 protein [Rhodococcus sp. OK302]OYD69870.1 cellulose synthase/poly-beta-1,6-N-acetylglucosamine synthase-like glycosyltransferase [Rhodococcus sp. OK302]
MNSNTDGRTLAKTAGRSTVKHRARRGADSGGVRPVADGVAEALFELSDGEVVAAPPSGPVFAHHRPVRRKSASSTFVHALSTETRAMIGLLTVGWLVGVAFFWWWWLAPEHRLGWFGLIVNSALLSYICLRPCYVLIAANRLRKVNPKLPIPELRVALVVTKAPSEPWAMVRETLEAMLAQQFPYAYDVWLCDEAPSAEISAWCEQHGVSVSTRNGRSDYHRDTWPRRTKCKEGNLAFFYDTVGYDSYDVVSQLDADHVPAVTYLAEMVRPFADPAIGYVSAPSLCDSNADQSWSARGRLYRESTFHGPFQLGHNHGLSPLCIGSHYAVRTAAVRSIGGIGPELAEDFSTTYLLNTAGWSGAFAIDAEAHGEGPATFGAMLTQEFQWSRSLAVVLLTLVPRTVVRLPWSLRIRFVFALSYYPLLVFTTTVGLMLPPIAAVTGVPWVRVNYLDFLAHWFIPSLFLFVITVMLRWKHLLRPKNASLFSWEAFLYALAGFPIIAWGLMAACIQQIVPRPVVFKVTPKGTGELAPMPVGLVVPYLVISVVLSGAAIIGIGRTGAVGYIGLCLIAALCYNIVACAAPILHAKEGAKTVALPFGVALLTVWKPLCAWMIVSMPLFLALAAYPGYLMKELGL